MLNIISPIFFLLFEVFASNDSTGTLSVPNYQPAIEAISISDTTNYKGNTSVLENESDNGSKFDIENSQRNNLMKLILNIVGKHFKTSENTLVNDVNIDTNEGQNFQNSTLLPIPKEMPSFNYENDINYENNKGLISDSLMNSSSFFDAIKFITKNLDTVETPDVDDKVYVSQDNVNEPLSYDTISNIKSVSPKMSLDMFSDRNGGNTTNKNIAHTETEMIKDDIVLIKLPVRNPKDNNVTLQLCSCSLNKKDNKKCIDDDTKNIIKKEVSYGAQIDLTHKNIICKSEESEFLIDDFQILPTGDLLIEHSGLLIHKHDYCLVENTFNSRITFNALVMNAKVCKKPIKIPQCCQPNYSLDVNGNCKFTSSAIPPLRPPIASGHCRDSETQSFIETFHNAISCNKLDESMEIIKLNPSNKIVTSGNTVLLKINDSGIRNFCVESKFDENGKSIHKAAFCNIKHNISHNENWIRKCCPLGYSIRENECHCDDSSWEQLFTQTLYNFGLNSLKKNKLLDLIQCQGNSLTHSMLTVSKASNILHSTNEKEYCIDEEFDEVEDNMAFQQSYPGLAAPIINIKCDTTWQTVKRVIIPASLFLSCICLCATLLCHIIVPKLRDLHGLCLVSYVASLLLADFTNFLLWMYVAKLPTNACKTVGFLLQFGFLATFFWLNVMCYDIWRYVRMSVAGIPLHAGIEGRNTGQFKYLIYALYAWGFPVMIVILTAIIKPEFANNCWFKEESELLAFVYGPMVAMVIANAFFIISTGIKLYTAGTQNCHCFFLNQSENMPTVVNFNKNHVNEFWQRFTLFSLMVSCWATEVIAWKVKPEEIWALTDILNALQGIFIFIIFIRCHKKRNIVHNHFLEIHAAFTISNIKMKLNETRQEVKRIFFRVFCCKNIPYTAQWYGDPIVGDGVSQKTENTTIDSMKDSNVKYDNDQSNSNKSNWNSAVWTMPSWKSPWSNSYFPNIISHGNEATNENISYVNDLFLSDSDENLRTQDISDISFSTNEDNTPSSFSTTQYKTGPFTDEKDPWAKNVAE